MIALLLAAQLSAQALAPPPPSQPSRLRPSNELIRVMPGKQACMGDPGQIEASLKTKPAALYRKGDRPAKPYLNWADYPDGTLCAVGASQ